VDVLILARHAESEFSVQGLMNGDPLAAVGLTAAGRAQARRLGELLAETPLDLCVTTEFLRVRETADVALAGRGIPRLVVPELNEQDVGEWERRPFADYRIWAGAHGPEDVSPGGCESRVAIASRLVRGYRIVLEREERTILCVGHGLPIRYLLGAAAGLDPEPLLENVGYAEPHRLGRDEVERAVERLEAWCAAPAW
jgi:broad specificity phosphatase PhoE